MIYTIIKLSSTYDLGNLIDFLLRDEWKIVELKKVKNLFEIKVEGELIHIYPTSVEQHADFDMETFEI